MPHRGNPHAACKCLSQVDNLPVVEGLVSHQIYNFVCATKADFRSHAAFLRNYTSPNEEIDCKIWGAASTFFFDSITIVKYGETFINGGVLVNNPVEVISPRRAKFGLICLLDYNV
jgi:hypothetical protein